MKNVQVLPLGGGPVKFSDFTELHGIQVRVHERPVTCGKYTKRWYAESSAEVKGHGVLRGNVGDGDTPEEAVEDYKAQLLGNVIVFEAYNVTRREIQCPNEWLPEDEDVEAGGVA